MIVGSLGPRLASANHRLVATIGLPNRNGDYTHRLKPTRSEAKKGEMGKRFDAQQIGCEIGLKISSRETGGVFAFSMLVARRSLKRFTQDTTQNKPLPQYACRPPLAKTLSFSHATFLPPPVTFRFSLRDSLFRCRSYALFFLISLIAFLLRSYSICIFRPPHLLILSVGFGAVSSAKNSPPMSAPVGSYAYVGRKRSNEISSCGCAAF